MLLLGLASAVPLGSEGPAGLKTIFYCPNFLDSPNLKGQVPVFISPRNRVAQLSTRALGSFSVASYGSQSYSGDILTRLHTALSTGICYIQYKYYNTVVIFLFQIPE
jgi:hypothetical protein